MNLLLIRSRRDEKGRGGPLALRFLVALLIVTAITIAALVLAGGGTMFALYYTYAQDLPSAEEIRQRSVETFRTTCVYDRTGERLLYELTPRELDENEDLEGARRIWVPLSEMPAHLRNATIAMEDKTFYTNPGGINVEGFFRAVRGELLATNEGGGSSISQQLVRMVAMTAEERYERSWTRKIKEMVLAIELDRRYPGVEGRDQILEWYLNNIFYGYHSYGVEAAAQTYFGKSVRDISLAEAAMLAPLGQSPVLNPIDHPAEAQKRQAIVLDQMVEQGYISIEEANEAKREEITLATRTDIGDTIAPHFLLYVEEQLIERFGAEAVYFGGLKVITSLDYDTQLMVQEEAEKHIADIEETRNAHNTAVVVIDAKTAEIRAMLGSLDFENDEIDGQVNMAITPRQPGSSFKPFTYATAFAQGYTPATMVMDVRTSFGDPPNPKPYVPENYSRTFHGPILLRRALACSYNVPAVAVMNMVGIKNVLDTAHAMGITTLQNPDEYGLSLTLGGGEVRLIDMTYAYGVFANNGTMLGEVRPNSKPGYRQLDPVAVVAVRDADGQTLYEYKTPQRQSVLKPQVSYLITDILSDNNARAAAFGYDNVLTLEDRPVAAKTGSTDDFKAGWTLGYTPQYVTGVWVGNTDNESMENAPGVRTAGPLWHNIMENLHQNLPVEAFTRPPGLETAVVDATSGKLPTEYSGQRIQELFIEGTVPTEKDDVHQVFRICKASGELATVYCPESEVEEKVFEIYPPEAEDWVRNQGIPQPPDEHCDLHGPTLTNSDVAITEPGLFEIVRGVVAVMGNAKATGQERFSLSAGEGMDPTSWSPITGDQGHQVNNGVLGEWNTEGFDGLYTLKLDVIDGGTPRDFRVQVLVDNISPTITILGPAPGEAFEYPKDEWINLQVAATDNTSMDRVEFFMDNESLGYTTVAPYSLRWMLAMSNTNGLPIPAHDFALTGERESMENGQRIIERGMKTESQRIYTRIAEGGSALTVTASISGQQGLTWNKSWPNGRSVVSDTVGYTETHTVYGVAYDKVGNQIESDRIKVHIVPEEKKKDEDRTARLGTPVLLPNQRPDRRWAWG